MEAVKLHDSTYNAEEAINLLQNCAQNLTNNLQKQQNEILQLKTELTKLKLAYNELNQINIETSNTLNQAIEELKYILQES